MNDDILKMLGLPADALSSDTRAMAATDEDIEAVLDQHVARGALALEERAAWRRRLLQQPELTREILDGMPGDARLAERAYARDRRIHTLGDALDSYLGIPEEDRVIEYSEDASLSDSERLYRRLMQTMPSWVESA